MSYIIKWIAYISIKLLQVLCTSGLLYTVVMLFVDFEKSVRWIWMGLVCVSALVLFLFIDVWRKNKFPLPGRDYL